MADDSKTTDIGVMLDLAFRELMAARVTAYMAATRVNRLEKIIPVLEMIDGGMSIFDGCRHARLAKSTFYYFRNGAGLS